MPVTAMAIRTNETADLRQLSDAELAQRLGQTWARHDKADAKLYSTLRLSNRRGTTKSSKLYRFWAALSGSPGFRVIDWGVKMMMASAANSDYYPKRLLVQDEAVVMDDELREIRDIMDEMERRVAGRKAGKP